MTPNGWTTGKVSDVIQSLESGVSVNGEDRKLEPNELGVLKVSAVSYGYFNPIACKAINIEEIPRAKINPKKGQVIISRSNTPELVGASAYIDKDYSHLFLPDKLWQTIPKPNQNMKWLSYVLALPSSRYYLSDLATGTSSSMKNITQEAFLSLKLLIPSVPEQQKIAEILSTWDKAIASTENLIANSEMQKKALMQQLLTGKKRLLDENGVRFSGEWKKIALKKLLFEVSKDKEKNPNELELLTVKLHYKGAVASGKHPIATEKGRPYYRRYAGELVIGRQNLHNGGIAIVDSSCDGLIASNAISSFKETKIANLDFMLALMSTEYFKFTIDTLTGGTGQKEISIKELLKVNVLVPRKDEQEKIAEVLSNADREIELLKAKLEHLKQEKKALMQQLLTGKRRVVIN